MELIIFHEESENKRLRKLLLSCDKSKTLVLVSYQSILKTLKIRYPDITIISYNIDEMPSDKERVIAAKKFVNNLESELNNEFQLIFPYSNIIYSNFYIYVANTLDTIEKLLVEYNIEKITLMNGNPKMDYSSISLAERERVFRIFYKRAWMLNYFVGQKYSDEINVNWKYKDSYLKLKILKLIKNKSMLNIKLILNLLKRIKKKKHLKRKDFGSVVFFMARTPLQVDPLINIYKELKKEKDVEPVFLVSESYFQKNVTNKIDNLGEFNYLDISTEISIKDIIREYYYICNILRNIRKLNIPSIEFGKSNLKISNTVVSELSTYWIDYLLKMKALNNINEHTEIKAIINTEIVNHNGAYDSQWGENNNIIVQTIQWVPMFNVLKPIMGWANKIYMMDYKDFLLASKLTTNDNFKYVGPVGYDSVYDKSKASKLLKKIVVFTQPDDYRQDYLILISDLVDIIRTLGINVNILVKLHPRERERELFEKSFENVEFLEIVRENITSQELIINSDLTISITSGTIVQSVIIGTPTLAVDYELKRNTGRVYMEHEIFRKIINKNELENIFIDYQKFHTEYFDNREKYIHEVLRDYNGNAALEVVNNLKKEWSRFE